MTARLAVVAREELRLRLDCLRQLVLNIFRHPAVIVLAGALEQRAVGRVLDQRVLEDVARALAAPALVEQLVVHQLTESVLQHRLLAGRQ